jgi:hypothetical protein
MGNRPHYPFIHIIDDDSFLIIFNFCRPVLIDEDKEDDRHILQGGNWTRERWWYKLAQVCQRWRHLVLASAPYLDLCLVCTHGTPVADMLAHSPPLPLIVDYLYDHIKGSHGIMDYLDNKVAAEDKEGVALALQHRNRVRRIRLQMPASIMEWFIAAIDGEFPVLEYLYFGPPPNYMPTLMFPETFQAPRLRHILLNTAIPIGSPLLITCVGLVTLSLQDVHRSAYFSPNNLLQRLSPMLHLETLRISLDSPIPNWEIGRQLLLTPITTTVTLPNLRWFGFGGPNAYLEALLLHITAPLLEKFQVLFLDPRTFRVSYLLQFMSAAENLSLRFGSVKFRFYDDMVDVWAYPRKGIRKCYFYMRLHNYPIQQQLLDTAQIFRALRALRSPVEHLDLETKSYIVTSAGPTQWRDFLGTFGSVKSLLAGHRLVGDISRSFRLDEGESPTVLLPELKELSYSYSATSPDAGDVFIAVADARQKAGCPVTLSCSL